MTLLTKKPEKHIQSIVAKDSHLTRLIQKATQMSLVKTTVSKLIAPELAAILSGISLHEDILTLITHNPEWATRLRFASIELLTQLRCNPQLGLVKKIQVHIAPDLNNHITTALHGINLSKTTKSKRQAPKTISRLTAEQLKLLAEQVGNIDEDGKKLKEALQRLAQRANNP